MYINNYAFNAAAAIEMLNLNNYGMHWNVQNNSVWTCDDTRSPITTTTTQSWNPPIHSDEVMSQLDNTLNDKNKEHNEEETFQYEDEPSSSSKRLNIKLMLTFKNSSSNNHNEFNIELVEARFEVIAIRNKDGFDGFINPIRQTIETMITLLVNLALFAWLQGASHQMNLSPCITLLPKQLQWIIYPSPILAR